MDLREQIRRAAGDGPVDLLLTNARVVNVWSGEIHPASVAIHQGIIVGFGEYEAVRRVDLEGRYLAPGFIDGHIHIESSMLAVPELARQIVPLGTTALVADPHEIANVLGVDGVRYLLESSENVPLRVFLMFPSCVPATPFETSGAVLSHADMAPFKDHERVLGLAEMMNFPGLIGADPEILAKIAVFKDKVLDGHAPGLSGKGLNAYAGAGIRSDHECTTLEEAQNKLRVGMRIMIRQGSAAKNLETLLPVVNDHNSRNCFFVTDDLDPRDIGEHGHINNLIRMAIARGLNPVRAIQMATLNTASYFRIPRLGAIVPGYEADLVVLEDLERVTVHSVYQKGSLVAQEGTLMVPSVSRSSVSVRSKVIVDWDKVRDFTIPASGTRANIIGVVPGQVVTRRLVEAPPVRDGLVIPDTERDILKIAVIERHKGTGAYAVALIKGFGLQRGAMASTVAHDAHNIIVVGANDADMFVASRELAVMGGGFVVVDNGVVTGKLPLPIAGLMSDAPVEEVKAGLAHVREAAQKLGCPLEAPFAVLAFMALTPIPELKLTDQGLFDSVNFRFISLFD